MLVKVRLLGSLKPPNVRGEIEVDLPTESKIATLIEELLKLYPEIANSLRNLSTSNLIILDGVEIENLNGLDTPVANGSKIVLVPVTHGGR
jgi:molybdopterin converting factor small subunit